MDFASLARASGTMFESAQMMPPRCLYCGTTLMEMFVPGTVTPSWPSANLLRDSNDLKHRFFWSLIMSRLMFNIHIVVPTPKYLSIVNSVYMRGLRRIGNMCRHGHTISDFEVRHQLKMPSIDCLFSRARLRYLARVIKHEPLSLTALLASQPRKKTMPWTSLVLKDMDALRDLVSFCARLPDPRLDSAAWIGFINGSKHWGQSIQLLHFYASSCDKAPPQDAARAHIDSFRCHLCESCFPSARARDSHARAKHGVRCPQRRFAPGDGICPVCNTAFQSRLRLLAHLCDSRRTRCWDSICLNSCDYPALDDIVVAELDTLDAAMRLDAQRAGHSHAIAKKPAKTASGKTIGCTRQ